jgi:hypothetical protein
MLINGTPTFISAKDGFIMNLLSYSGLIFLISSSFNDLS